MELKLCNSSNAVKIYFLVNFYSSLGEWTHRVAPSVKLQRAKVALESFHLSKLKRDRGWKTTWEIFEGQAWKQQITFPVGASPHGGSNEPCLLVSMSTHGLLPGWMGRACGMRKMAERLSTTESCNGMSHPRLMRLVNHLLCCHLRISLHSPRGRPMSFLRISTY